MNELTCEDTAERESAPSPLNGCPNDMIEVDSSVGSIAKFCLDRTEVLAEDFASFPDAQADTRRGCTYAETKLSRFPINCVSWYGARGYCRWKGRRLPTAEEWELAAVGGQPTFKYPWKPEALEPDPSQVCWNRPVDGPCEVGEFDAISTAMPQRVSRLGFLDLGGNVWEWTNTRITPDRQLSVCPSRRIVRGGSYYNTTTRQLEVKYLNYKEPGVEHTNVGFRCAADLK